MKVFAFLFFLSAFFLQIDSKQQRSRTQRNYFLVDQGYCQTTTNCRVPEGYEVDHKIPLYAGGADSPSNMQLLTKEKHKEKTRNDQKIYYPGINFFFLFFYIYYFSIFRQKY